MEGDARFGVVEQGAEAAHLRLAEERTVEEVGRELYGDLAHVGHLVVVVFPSVFDFRPHEDEVVVAEHFYAVADDAFGAIAVSHEVELILLVAVNGIVEGNLVPVDEIEAVAVVERRYFGYRMVHK